VKNLESGTPFLKPSRASSNPKKLTNLATIKDGTAGVTESTRLGSLGGRAWQNPVDEKTGVEDGD